MSGDGGGGREVGGGVDLLYMVLGPFITLLFLRVRLQYTICREDAFHLRRTKYRATLMGVGRCERVEGI